MSENSTSEQQQQRTVYFAGEPDERGERVEVASALASDLDELHTVINQAYRVPTSSGQAGWTTEGDMIVGDRLTVSDLACELARPHSEKVTLVALLHRAEQPSPLLVGTIQVAAQPDGVAELGSFAVRPSMQSRGFGRRLLDAAERLAVDHFRAHQARIYVIESRHELIAVYTRRGYRLVDGHAFSFRQTLGDRFGLPIGDDQDYIFQMFTKQLA